MINNSSSNVKSKLAPNSAQAAPSAYQGNSASLQNFPMAGRTLESYDLPLIRTRSKFTIQVSASVLREAVSKFIPQIKISEQRQLGKIKFSGQSLVFTLLIACMFGNRTSSSIERFWKENQELLKKAIPLMPDLPVSHDTIKRTLDKLVFNEFELVLESFTLQVLFESLSDQHIGSGLSQKFIPYYKEVLYEYNLMHKERSTSVEEGGSPIKPPYLVVVFPSTLNTEELRPELRTIYLNRIRVIDSVRKYKCVGCSAKANIVIKQPKSDDSSENQDQPSSTNLVRPIDRPIARPLEQSLVKSDIKSLEPDGVNSHPKKKAQPKDSSIKCSELGTNTIQAKVKAPKNLISKDSFHANSALEAMAKSSKNDFKA